MGIDAVVVYQVLAAQHPFVCGHGSSRTRSQVRSERLPGVGARRHLPQRPERKPTGLLRDHGADVFTRGVECQPIFGILGGRPQLQAALLEGVTASLDQLDDPIPLPRRRESVDESYESIQVAGGDSCG